MTEAEYNLIMWKARLNELREKGEIRMTEAEYNLIMWKARLNELRRTKGYIEKRIRDAKLACIDYQIQIDKEEEE